MPTIQICVLANSVKNSHRYVAGLETEKGPDGKRKFGGWIRPVSKHDEGALTLDERALRKWLFLKNEPQAFDVIELEVDRNESDPLQPESWLITPGKPWKLVEKLSWKDVQPYIDRPKDLWLENQNEWERISPNWLRRQARVQSLYLIKPESIYIETETEFDRTEKRNKNIRRVVFTYNRYTYRLPLTDPEVEKRYPDDASGGKVGFTKSNLASGNDCLLCLTYTPRINNGFHYKVVAAILEPAK